MATHTPPAFRSISGQAESAESGGNINAPARKTAQQGSPGAAKSHPASGSTSSTPVPQLRKQPSSNLVPLASPSAGTSPRNSRQNSPARRDNRPSAQPSVPSAAAIQRVLSATSVPQVASGGALSEALSRLPRAQRSAGGSGENTPQWPSSPRLKSPPSTASSRRGSAIPSKKAEPSAAPNIVVQAATPSSSTPSSNAPSGESSKTDLQLQAPPKVPSRGPSGKTSTLDTVQEDSAGTTPPSNAPNQVTTPKQAKPSSDDDLPSTIPENSAEDDSAKHTKVGESGSESGGNKSDRRRRRQSQSNDLSHAQRPKTPPPKSAYTPLSSAKSRQPEGTRNMTVETETVSSIPQTALNAGDRSGRNDNSGSVRLKPSNETIRPKKERKKHSRKAPSINQGTVSNRFVRKASSKADIFEARVANAVADEANSSDSDETFVYESNPPETQYQPRHHSRTPSATSAHSQADAHRGIRNFGNMTEGGPKVGGKRSMKFSSNPYNESDSPTDRGDGTVRAHRPTHIGRLGRGGRVTSMFDPDSPFTQASKLRNNVLSVRHSSRPNSPRRPVPNQHKPSPIFTHKGERSYDFDGEGADDERTPLVNSIRTPRGRHSRRLNSGSVRSEEYYSRQDGRWGRCGGCLLVLIVFVAVLCSAAGFLVMSNRAMYEVRIAKIQNVLASEQELMLDVLVGAVNPNALGITVTDMDVNVFAKSKHVGTGAYWREHGHAPQLNAPSLTRRRHSPPPPPPQESPASPSRDAHPSHPLGGVDAGTDPIDDSKDAQTMLLGRIYHFDTALTFEGSPLKRHLHYSLGELRLMQPGNRTEQGGSARWEAVLQHPFELIVRGVLKYQLPISCRAMTAAIGARVLVHPEDGVDGAGNVRVSEVELGDDVEVL